MLYDQGTEMSDDELEAKTSDQRRVLLQVLGLNVVQSASLAAAGVIADSSGLLANAIDNASDSAVYAISYFAVGRPARWKTVAATASGVLLLLFGLGVLVDAVRRFVTGSEPVGAVMMAASVLSAGVSMLCLRLLKPLKSGDVNLRAAETFSLNDFVANLGILVAGGLVAWTGRRWPDLVVGLAVAAVAAKGGYGIFRDARRTAGEQDPPEAEGEGHAGVADEGDPAR